MYSPYKMELKVWVEGIQRVICGVTESTTCQDVVIALAHATGKTGRFTLVERWRDNERLLAPTEPPLKVLHKWGEYACDVQFILRHSDKDRRRTSGTGGISHGQGGSRSLDGGSKRTEKFLHNFSPHGELGSAGSHYPQRRSSGSSIRKSLTFSGAHTFFPPVKSSTVTPASSNSTPQKPVNSAKMTNGPNGNNIRHSETSSMESLDDQVSSASYSSGSSPYASLDKQRHHYSAMPTRNVMGGKNDIGGNQEQGVLPGVGLRPSPRRSPRPAGGGGHEHLNQSTQRMSTHPPQQLPASHIIPPQHPPQTLIPSNTSTPRSSPYKDTNSKSDILHTTVNNNNNIAKVVGTPQSQNSITPNRRVPASKHEYNLDHRQSQNLLQSSSPSVPAHQPAPHQRLTSGSSDASGSSNVPKVNGTKEGSCEQSPPSPASSKKEELLRLVKLQQERLGVQDSQLNILDSEIRYWEGREEDLNEQYETVQKETSRLQETERSLDSSLQELDLVSWVDKLEIEKQHEKMLQSELTLVRSQIANAESELLATKSKITSITSDVEEEKRKQHSHEQENKEQEIRVLQEISDLQKQINRKLLQHEGNAGSLEHLAADVKSLESDILEKKTQIADWEKELRSVNMDIFTQAPSTDWLKPPGATDWGKEKGFGRLSPSRPGSSRKIHNPQLLKETVATTKNPHGMWV